MLAIALKPVLLEPNQSLSLDAQIDDSTTKKRGCIWLGVLPLQNLVTLSCEFVSVNVLKIEALEIIFLFENLHVNFFHSSCSKGDNLHSNVFDVGCSLYRQREAVLEFLRRQGLGCPPAFVKAYSMALQRCFLHKIRLTAKRAFERVEVCGFTPGKIKLA